MAVISDSELSWVVVKSLAIVSSSFVSLLAVAWAVVRRWSSK